MIEVDDMDGLTKELNAIADQFRSLSYKPTLEKTMEFLEELHNERFETDTDPLLLPWRPLAAYTVRKKGHDTILEEKLRLRPSLTEDTSGAVRAIRQQAHDQGLVFGTEVPYTIFQQYGTDIIPARPVVGLNYDNTSTIAESVVNDTVTMLAAKNPK